VDVVELVAASLVTKPVDKTAVGPAEWVAAEGDGDDLVDFGCHRVEVVEGLVDGSSADGAGGVGGEDSAS